MSYPIILAHGIARFDIINYLIATRFGNWPGFAGDSLSYFRGIRTHLERRGHVVFETNVSFAGSVDLRAKQLYEQIVAVLTRVGSNKVHIIAHSMGGLDARHMIVDHSAAPLVASLTTIGTPHQGTPVADLVVREDPISVSLARALHLDGVADLTPAACQAFNQRAEGIEAANAVMYRVCTCSEAEERVFSPLRPLAAFLSKTSGENDGFVPRLSQRWLAELRGYAGQTKPVAVIDVFPPADHLNELGWWDPSEWNLGDGVDLVAVAKAYETSIRDAYAALADSLGEID